MVRPEYGARAVFGVAVPQSNPTVEPEMWSLAPSGVSVLTTRLQGSKVSSKDRLVDYITNLNLSLDAYDVAPIDAVGIACTGSSYLLGGSEEKRLLATHEAKYKYPIITAAQAITRALHALDVRKIALVAPYPAWLINASYSYWVEAGMTSVSVTSYGSKPEDTREVYGMTSDLVQATTRELDLRGVEVVVLTGTGVPTLRVIAAIAQSTGRPVISSNLALMWALLKMNPATESLAGEPMDLLATCRNLDNSFVGER
jgi:maleate isomerase